MNRQFLRAAAPLWLLLSSAVPLCAQTAPAAPAAYQPPSLRFDGAGMSLVDAVRLTLQHDPTIKLREADVAFQQGIVRSQKGIFDSLFRLNGSFSREQTELLDSQKLDQQQTRSDLKSAIGEAQRLADSLNAAGALLADKNQAFNNPAGFNLSSIKDPEVLNQMSLLQSELVLYHDILASPTLTDAKVRTDLINLRDQTVGKNIDYFNSQQSTIAGVPGELQTSLDNLGPSPEDLWNKESHVTADVFKLFRTGIQIHPYADLKYDTSNYVGKKRSDVEFGGLGVSPLSDGQIGFDVVLPLLRNRGRDSVAAAETASKYDLEATRLDLLFQQSQSVLATIEAYWQARAAADQVDILRRSVEIQGELGNLTRTLIAANEKPRSDEARVLAATADARSRYEAGQRQLNDARINLAQVMGVALADAFSIPLATDPYPQPPADLQIDPLAYGAFIKDSVNRRFDQQAALKTNASGKALLEGARIDKRPLLNVNASGWGTSVQETLGYDSWVFRSGSAGLSFEKPFGNNTAGGLYDERRASLRRTEIDSSNLSRVIALNVVQLSESLKIAADRLRSADEAVRNYDQTMTTEQTRLRAGDSSLVDTILTEQQSTGARLAYVSAQQEYATLLAMLRHEAGLLVQDGTIDGAQLVTIPPALVRR